MMISFLPMLTALGLIVWHYRRFDFLFSFPTMMAGSTLYFVVPGLINAERNNLVSESTLAAASLYVTLSLCSGAWGWNHPFMSVRRILSHRRPFPNTRLLLRYSVGALVFSAFFAYKLLGVDPTLIEQTQWSGVHVIYYTLQQPGYYITSVGAIAYGLTGRVAFAICSLTAFAVYILPPALTGHRDEIVESAVIGAVLWALVWKRPIPKPLALTGGVILALLFSAIGTYRSTAKESGILEGLSKALSSETRETEAARPPEMKYVEVNNFLGVVDCYLNGRMPTFGLNYWNGFIHRYVPGQLIGKDQKEALKAPDNAVTREDVMKLNLPSTMGSTFTGFSDTLQAFYVFGPLMYFGIGSVLRSVFLEARRGSATALFIYPNLLVLSGVAITHGTNYILFGSLNLVIWMLVWVIPMQRRAESERPQKTLSGGNRKAIA